MFLKQLEILGFKSFAKKVSIEFVPGVTAVVGPNGSGKSNITDAIKWVLGEQSAKTLRGAKMEDIIFAGSDSKQALNMAEVTLVLDNMDHHINVDYTEVSVTRRVFRSGESDFLLNGQKCRLKDIIDLFMDSGLGREAYSIISQGKIDDILNSRADEKRKIFEEAAGVLKYKTRKQQAEKKLIDSEEHLNRVEDIIHELTQQVGPLEVQASIAKDYLEKKEELETIEVGLLAHDIEVTHSKWEAKTKEVEALQEKEVNFASQIRLLEASGEADRQKIEAYDESIEELQESLLLVSEQLEKAEGQRNVLEERRKNAEESAESLDKRLSELREKRAALEERLELEETDYHSKRQVLTSLEAELHDQQTLLTNFEQGMEERLESLKSDYFSVVNREASIRHETQYLSDQRSQLAEKQNEIEANAQDSVSQWESQVEEEQRLAKELEQKRSERDRLRKRFAELDQEIDGSRATYERNLQLYQKISNTLEQTISRRDMLKELEEDHAGFFGGVKMVLNAAGKKTLKGIRGAVAELIQVNQSYETAIETALGGAMQHVVVETEANGREAIQFLKKRQGGRATFLPMSVMKARSLSGREQGLLEQQSGFLGTGDRLVRFAPEYQGVIGQLLGHVVIATDLKTAGELAKIIGYRYRIVTLDGDVISPGGAMSGGSRKLSSSQLLGRGREIEQLEKKILELTGQKEKGEAKLKELREHVQSLNAEARKTRDNLEKLTNAYQELESEHQERLFEVKTIRDRQDLLKRDRSNFEEQYNGLTERLEQLAKELEDLSQKEEALKRQIDKLTDQKKNQEQSKTELSETITELKIKVAREQEVAAAGKDKCDRTRRELTQVIQDEEEVEQSKQRLGEALQLQDGDNMQLGDKISLLRQDKTAVTSWLAERRKIRLDLSEALKQNELELKELKRLHRGVTEALRREEVLLERLDVELENLMDTLREEYELGYESAKVNYPLSMDADEARKKVKLIKRAIEELGTVNIGAIEEFDRVSTRLSFLTTQRDDLLEAKQTLLDVIDEMDDEVSNRFKETFLAIREQFKSVFKELFGGGRADLVLSDPEDYLESGVDILAQPPGKKLQHLSLLSGGERALTAIALLFAILKVRPVPFCVLDEVEAALDDANVDRYADYLTKFSKETQFIVVTHRKGTMEKADVLYGVTMQESGISRLVSVRLEETAELVG
ncbi:chromosome segregation protein SMC [Pullulanibacillus sp. KACC 23026]|uniref:chromosome segregation protein SMC n=1 Tax=Pullulanibacillus sp. KACC 23026 TaxID=3028315 RepID=UPI0023AF8568|nr:chromosome segregation protein SMC [Pullulanibacillus sp. KACC 23026]WEG11612.1 chromosome segregation protein SMC [Pullulanibacillus sp. KACC 23026]